jgi:hypothetical protein
MGGAGGIRTDRTRMTAFCSAIAKLAMQDADVLLTIQAFLRRIALRHLVQVPAWQHIRSPKTELLRCLR